MSKCSQEPLNVQVGEERVGIEAAMACHEGLIHSFIRLTPGACVSR